MTEWDAIKIVQHNFTNCHNWRLIFPNSHLYGWESDILRLTKSGLVHEYEIKLTRSDFLADAKKDKHVHIKNFLNKTDEVPRLFQGRDFGWKTKTIRPSNYFWYVVPEGMVEISELPEYAGLLEIRTNDDGHSFLKYEITKAAPRLHKEKINEGQIMQLLTSMTIRFWSVKR